VAFDVALTGRPVMHFYSDSPMYLLSGVDKAQLSAFVDYYNSHRYHESIDNLTPADVYFGRGKAILAEREKTKRKTIAERRLQHQLQA